MEQFLNWLEGYLDGGGRDMAVIRLKATRFQSHQPIQMTPVPRDSTGLPVTGPFERRGVMVRSGE